MRKDIVKIILITFLVLVAVFSNTCVASDLEEFEYYAGDPIPPNSPDIINFKGKLNEQGFYISGASEENLHTTTLDDETMAAVKLVCDLNPDLTYYQEGVTRILCWRVMGTYGEPLKTPLDDAYQVLTPGSTGNAVARIQTRLSRLGYNKDAGFSFASGVYDDGLQEAIDSFVDINGFYYDREQGITVELQELLYSNDAKAYEKTSKRGMLGYLQGSSRMFGHDVPNIAILIASFVLLCVIVLLVLKLVSSNDKGPIAKDSTNQIRFKVEYGGNSCEHVASLKSTIAIGRSVGDFPLNASDTSISRNHCEIKTEGKSVYLIDHSTYGTKVNGKLCHNCKEVLRPYDVLEIGEHKVTVYFSNM